MTKNDFSPEMPLITPERLKTNLHDALSFRPRGARDFFLLDSDPSGTYDLNTVIVVVGGDERHSWFCSEPCMAAIMCELLRYGHSLKVTNDGSARRHHYLSIRFDGGNEEMIVGRLVLDALAHERVRSSGSGHDLRAPTLHKEGAGQPRKDSRDVSTKRAAEAAKKHGLTDAQTAAYLANLRALFALHDEVATNGF